MATSRMSVKNTRTMQQIYQNPVSHNLSWSDIVALIQHLGTVKQDGGDVTLAIGAISQVFHRAPGKDVSETKHVMELRSFFAKAGVGKTAAA